MKIVLFALNCSFSHTNLAVRCLKKHLDNQKFEVKIVEKNLKDRRGNILDSLISENADIYGFSCYIFNISQMLEIASDLRAVNPNCRIVFGGPEVSSECERFCSCDFLDAIICGEGELSFAELCTAFRDGKPFERIINGKPLESLEREGIMYSDGDRSAGTIVYYESSRGCPYSCSFCLSGNLKGKIKQKSIEETLSELLEFEKLGDDIKIIKFVDRTFNADVCRANAIWSALLDERFTKSYHFEICASLLNEQSFKIFKSFPKGKIQLEIGIQSTNENTLREISRTISPQRAIEAAARIKALGNIHVHVDLIAGLPFEDYESFSKSFDDTYFCGDMLQLGFLKVLPGTRMREKAAEYGMVYSQNPPYNVLKTACLDFSQIRRLEQISDLLERYHESQHFSTCLDYILRLVESPFRFYENFLDFIALSDGREIRKISQNDAYRLLYEYATRILSSEQTLSLGQMEEFSSLMHDDYKLHEARRALPFMRKK